MLPAPSAAKAHLPQRHVCRLQSGVVSAGVVGGATVTDKTDLTDDNGQGGGYPSANKRYDPSRAQRSEGALIAAARLPPPSAAKAHLSQRHVCRRLPPVKKIPRNLLSGGTVQCIFRLTAVLFRRQYLYQRLRGPLYPQATCCRKPVRYPDGYPFCWPDHGKAG